MTTSIFGQSAGKVVYSGVSHALDNSILQPTWADDKTVEDESVIDGTRTFTHLWVHAEFKVIVYLFRYADPAAKFNELIALNHKDVTYYPFKDGAAAGDGLGKAIQDSSSTVVPCRIIKMEPYSLDDYQRLDVLAIYLKTTKPFDITKSIA